MALNNNHLVKSEDELKREEEMVEDEMKEEEDELDDNEDALASTKTESNKDNIVTDKPLPVQGLLSENIKQIQLNWLKKMYEDLQKNKGPVPPSEISAGKPQFLGHERVSTYLWHLKMVFVWLMSCLVMLFHFLVKT